MTKLVLTEQRDAIFEIILNRPEKRNAINIDLFEAFDTAVTQANRTPNIRAVLIRLIRLGDRNSLDSIPQTAQTVFSI